MFLYKKKNYPFEGSLQQKEEILPTGYALLTEGKPQKSDKNKVSVMLKTAIDSFLYILQKQCLKYECFFFHMGHYVWVFSLRNITNVAESQSQCYIYTNASLFFKRNWLCCKVIRNKLVHCHIYVERPGLIRTG